MNEKPEWIPYLNTIVPVMVSDAEMVSLYTIAFEGWRRGLSLRFYNRSRQDNLLLGYSLSSGKREHHFQVSKGDKVSEEALKVCKNKWLTKEYLMRAKVPVPMGKLFKAEATEKEIIKYAQEVGFPLVLKPTTGSGGLGVIPNIRDVETLKDSLRIVREKHKKKEVLIEQHFDGDEFRIYVIDGKVLGAVNRIPANVIGDGIHTISQLIEQKNEFKKKVPHLANRPIKVNDAVVKLLAESNLTLDSIPEKGQQVFVKKVSNVSDGGDPIDVTDQLNDQLKEIAIRAVEAVPGLVQCGLDMIVNENRTSGVILELNTRPGIGSFLFPIQGQSKDVAGAIIDYYFPETKGKKDDRIHYYFEFTQAVLPLKRGPVREVNIVPKPVGQVIAKKISMSQEEDLVFDQEWIFSQAHHFHLNGYVTMANGELEIIVSTTSDKNFTAFMTCVKEKYKDVELHVEEWVEPVKLGFFIAGIESGSQTETIEKEPKLKNYFRLEKENDELEYKIEQIKQSNSWKLTAPLRWLENVSFFKKRS